MVAFADDPFIAAGVVHVNPSFEVENIGPFDGAYPTATNFPEEFTATPVICAFIPAPIVAGEVHVAPSVDVAKAPFPIDPTETNLPDEFTATPHIIAGVEYPLKNAGVDQTILGTTLLDAADAGDVPMAFVAVTLNV